jgi:very-short-patch-repair endonuclease
MPSLQTTPLLSTRSLRSRGLGPAQVAKALREEHLWQVHRGWYAEPGTDAQLIRAMRVGGRIGCVSALRLYGAWCPPDQGLHIAMPASSSGRRLAAARDAGKADDVTAHWGSKLSSQEWTLGVSDFERALGHAIECQPTHYTVAILDSLLFRRLTTASVIERVVSRNAAHHSDLLVSIDGRSEEGIESMARHRLREAGITAVPQVAVAGVGRVDLLVGETLVIELHGREFHATERGFVRDRTRRAQLQAAGYTVLEFTYAQVLYDWDRVLRTVLSALSLSR